MSTQFLPKPKLQSVSGGSPFSRTGTSWSSGGFPSPKLEPLDPTKAICEIRPNPARSSQIWRDLDHIWWDLARSSQIIANFSKNLQIPTKFCSFRQRFPVFNDDFQFPANFRIDRTDPGSTWTQNRFDRLTLAVGFESLHPPLDASRSGPNWVQNQLGPTRGQPWWGHLKDILNGNVDNLLCHS